MEECDKDEMLMIKFPKILNMRQYHSQFDIVKRKTNESVRNNIM